MGLLAFTLWCKANRRTGAPNPYRVHSLAFSPFCALVYDPYYWYEVIEGED